MFLSKKSDLPQLSQLSSSHHLPQENAQHKYKNIYQAQNQYLHKPRLANTTATSTQTNGKQEDLLANKMNNIMNKNNKNISSRATKPANMTNSSSKIVGSNSTSSNASSNITNVTTVNKGNHLQRESCSASSLSNMLAPPHLAKSHMSSSSSSSSNPLVLLNSTNKNASNQHNNTNVASNANRSNIIK